jgi:hypothetical protein
VTSGEITRRPHYKSYLEIIKEILRSLWQHAISASFRQVGILPIKNDRGRELDILLQMTSNLAFQARAKRAKCKWHLSHACSSLRHCV